MTQTDFLEAIDECEHSPIQKQRTGFIKLPSIYLKGDSGFYRLRQTCMVCSKCNALIDGWDNRSVTYHGLNPHEAVLGKEAYKAMIKAEEGVTEFWLVKKS